MSAIGCSACRFTIRWNRASRSRSYERSWISIMSEATLVPERAASEPETYDARDFERLFRIEDRHFWFQARNRILSAVFAQLVRNLPSGYTVLEVGCGTGNVLRHLEKACSRGTVVGMDLFAEGLKFARTR